MRDVLVASIGTEVDDEQRHGVPQAIDAAIRVHLSRGGRHESPIGERDIGVAHYRIGGQPFTVNQRHSAGAARHKIDVYPTDLRIKPDFAAEIREQPHERVDEGARASHGEPDTPSFFEYVNECVDRRAVERIPTDEERVKAEHLPQALVGEVAFRDASDGTVSAEADELREYAHHVRDRRERLVDERKGRIENALSGDAESIVPIDVAPPEPADFGA